MNVKQVQIGLNNIGFDPGPLDGVMGPKTRKALKGFQKSIGMIPDGIITRQVYEELSKKTDLAPYVDKPPWIEELERIIGLHESRDRSKLASWLRSAGQFVDPYDIPWCGDAVETAILRVLPDEPVPANPMASINWLKFGDELLSPEYGCILVFWRGSPKGWKGHVGFYVGEDKNNFFVLGGNQFDSVSISKLKKNRLRPTGIRWPSTYPSHHNGMILKNPPIGDIKLSEDEE